MRGQSIAYSTLAFFSLAVLRANAADPSSDMFKNAGLKKGSYIVELATAPSGKRDSEVSPCLITMSSVDILTTA